VVDPKELLAAAAAQSGVFSRTQALGAGLTPRQIVGRLRAGQWAELHPGVYGLAGHATTWRRRLWAAHLHAGVSSVLARETAGRLHAFEPVPAGKVVLIVAGRVRSPRDVTWMRTPDLAPDDVVHRPGLPPLTNPARTVVDLAAVLGRARLRLAVEQGILERRLTVAEVGAVLGRVRRSGKPGVRRLDEVLDAVGPGADLPRSELERLLDVVLARAGLPPPRHEHPLPGARGRTGFVDRYWPDAGLIVEADGRRWHARHQQMRADADRILEAQALGVETSRLLWEHLSHDPAGTAELLRAVYLARLGLLGPRSPCVS
jgi:hypothetical protein